MDKLHTLFLSESDAINHADHGALIELARFIEVKAEIFQGRTRLHFENLFAHAVAALEPVVNLPVGAFDAAWAQISSVIGQRNKFLSGKPQTTIASIQAAALQGVHRREEILAMTAPEAFEKIEAVVKLMQGRFPELKLSFGYIGNCDLAGGGKRYDDRSWRVFTGVRDARRYHLSVSFGGAATSEIASLAFDVTSELENWCENLARGLTTGDYLPA